MKSKVKVLIPLVAALAMLTSCKSDNPSTSGGGSGSVSPAVSIDPAAYGGYYAPFVDMLSVEGNELQFNLHKLCLITHTTTVTYKQFYNYTSASSKPRSIDQSPTDSSKNVFFYTGAENSKSTRYTREHVWPCANSAGLWIHDKSSGASSNVYNVDGSGYWGGGSDLYHVRPSSSFVNTARGNSKFKEFAPNDTVYEASDSNGKYSLLVDSDPKGGFATKSEPDDQLKGDIVRICMYVYIHYTKMGGQEWNWYYDSAKTKCVMGALGLSQVFAFPEDQLYEKLVEWNNLDPVDDLERLRNDTIQEIQGNRNPFVDYPELIAKCFGL